MVMLITARLPLVILASTTSASDNLLYAVSGLRVGSLEFGRLLQIEGISTVRALHFPLSHSFSHTNLKSPCAEQYANELNRGQGLGATYMKRRVTPGMVLRRLRLELLVLCAVFMIAWLLLGDDSAASIGGAVQDSATNRTDAGEGLGVCGDPSGAVLCAVWGAIAALMVVASLCGIYGMVRCRRIQSRGKLVADIELQEIEREVYLNWFNMFSE
eukprot:COSAG03_NODE_183_length_10952_cov_150.888694_2_plen_215_part_00